MMWFAKLKHASWTKSCLDTKYVTRLFPNLDDYTTNWMGPPRYPTQRSERRIYIRTLDPSEGRKLHLWVQRREWYVRHPPTCAVLDRNLICTPIRFRETKSDYETSKCDTLQINFFNLSIRM